MSDAREPDRERTEVGKRFDFHKATDVTAPKHGETRSLHRELALWILDNVPRSRERNLALTSLQSSMMWTNAAIAIHTEREPLLPNLLDRS